MNLYYFIRLLRPMLRNSSGGFSVNPSSPWTVDELKPPESRTLTQAGLAEALNEWNCGYDAFGGPDSTTEMTVLVLRWSQKLQRWERFLG